MSSVTASSSSRLAKAVDRTSGVLGGLAGFLVLGIALMTGYDVVMRYVFNEPTLWAQDYSIYSLVGMCFLSGAVVLRQKMHIKVDFFTERLGPRTRNLLDITTGILALVFMLVLARYSFDNVADAFVTKATFPTPVRPLRWPVYSTIFVGAVMLSLQQIKELTDSFRSAMNAGAEQKAATRDNPYSALAVFLILLAIGLWIVFQVHLFGGLIYLLFLLLFSGVPVAFALGLVAMMGFLELGGVKLLSTGAPRLAFIAMDSYTLLAIPLFILTGHIFETGKIGDEIFKFMNAWVGSLPGGLAAATIGACALFAAITGSSVACAATIALFALPALKAHGYNKNLSYGLLAGGGTLGILIPPSGVMIIYASVSNESLGALFMAGVGPGILVAILMGTYGVLAAVRSGQYERVPPTSWLTKLKATRSAVWALAAPVLILGGIYSGVFTPTEAGAIAVLYGLTVSLARRQMKVKDVGGVLLRSVRTTGFIAVIVVGAIMFGDTITRLKIADSAIHWVTEAQISPWAVIIGWMLLFQLLGLFLEEVSNILITVPIIYPIVTSLGFDGVWFGVLLVLAAEFDLLTPPVGLNLFVIKGISGDTLSNVMKGTFPFYLLLGVAMVLLAVFPQIALWLPSTMRMIR